MALFNYECDETKRIIDEVSPNYPQLTTFEKEWLYFHKYGYIPGIPVELECETVHVNPNGMVQNAIPYPYKRAILKGQTKIIDELGNECESNNSPKPILGAWINTITGKEIASATSFMTTFLKCPKNTFVIKGNNKYKRVVYYDKNKSCISGIDKSTGDNSNLIIKSSDIPANAVYMRISASIHKADTNYTPDVNLFIMDENGNNLYITHLESVKMPVLTTTGKNLFYVAKSNGYYNYTNGDWVNDERFKTLSARVLPNTKYTQNIERNNITFWKDGVFVSGEANSQTFTTPTNCNEVRVSCLTNIETFMLEMGEVVTTHESYKSNILTVNEEVELRGVGDAYDELNLLTGELTQRVGEMVLDGVGMSMTQDTSNGDYVRFNLSHYNGKSISDHDMKVKSNLKCDKLPVLTDVNNSQDCIHNGGANNYKLMIWLHKSKLNSLDNAGICQYLQSNPITIQYELATESVKTVDLTPLNKPYEGTNHYQLSSNIPCEAVLEVPVVSTGKQTLKEIND